MIVAGIGLRPNVDGSAIISLMERIAPQRRVDCLAAPYFRKGEAGVTMAADRLGVPLVWVDAQALAARQGACRTYSARALAAVGFASVAEGCALAGCALMARALATCSPGCASLECASVVAHPAAGGVLAESGRAGRLIVARQKGVGVTCALAECWA